MASNLATCEENPGSVRSDKDQETSATPTDFHPGGPMHARTFTCLVALALFALPGTLSAQDADEDAEARSEVALAWIDLLRTGDYEAAAAHVSEDERVASQMGSPEQLESIWTQLGAQLGELGSLEPKTEAMANGLHVVIMTGVFTNGTFDVQVVVDDERKVMGFFVRPPS